MKSISFADPEVQACPFPHYRQLREDAPVYLDISTGLYVITRFDDVRAILLDHRRFSNVTGIVQTRSRPEVLAVFKDRGWPLVPVLVDNDPPSHKRFRSMVDKAFTAKRVQGLESYVLGHVTRLIDRLVDRGEDVDFIREFAVPLPLTVISDLVGMPHDMMDRMVEWADASVALASPALTLEQELALVEHVIAFQRYFADRAECLRAAPENNLYSDLVNNAVDGQPPTTQELLSMMQVIMTGGYETTTSVLGSGMARLCADPALAETLRRAPDRIPAFCDEMLRINSPVQGLFRRAVEDVEIAGIPIPKDSVVMVRYGSANRDCRKFPEPDQVDLDRKNGAQHMAFSAGIHHCVGSILARGELRIAFAEILRRCDTLELARGDASWEHKTGFVTWGAQKLFVTMRGDRMVRA